jgi:hypothetical protein
LQITDEGVSFKLLSARQQSRCDTLRFQHRTRGSPYHSDKNFLDNIEKPDIVQPDWLVNRLQKVLSEAETE